MRSFSDQIRIMIPGGVALLLLFATALPLALGVPLAPHVVWLMALAMTVFYPPAWPPALAFALGLLSDFIMGTPLGAQALLSLVLTLWMHMQARRLDHQPMRVRWMEAAAMLLLLFVALWGMQGWVEGSRAPIKGVLIAAVVSALWYPVFYWISAQLAKLMPGGGL